MSNLVSSGNWIVIYTLPKTMVNLEKQFKIPIPTVAMTWLATMY